MKKKILGYVLMLLLVGSMLLVFHVQQVRSVEPPVTEWDETYGGTDFDTATSVVQLDDGGYAIAGNTHSFAVDWSDAWLIITDANGNVQWNETYNRQYRDEVYCLIRTSDGGYALAGSTRPSFVGPIDAWLVKVDASGKKQWDRPYGDSSDEYAYALLQTSDGGYAFAGQTSSSGAGSIDFWLVKTDADGNMEWNQPYGGPDREEAFSMVATDDGGYALVGYTESFGAGGYDCWLVKTDADGNMEWNQTYGEKDDDRGHSIVQTTDGGYALAGYTKSFGAGKFDAWLIKTDVNGKMQWNKTFACKLGTNDDYALSLIRTSDGGYALAGFTESCGAGESDLWIVKTDAVGKMQWNKTHGRPYRDEAHSAVQTSDGGYAIAGTTQPYGSSDFDLWLIKLAPEREPTKWAVVIGVDEYSYSELNSRGGPGNSAKDMNKTLVEYMSFPRDHVHLLVDEIDVSDDTVSRATIEDELEWLQAVTIPEDIVVFYYAGHGDQDSDTGHESIVTHTMDHIQDDEFAAEIGNITSQNLCVILDVSYSGGFIRDGQTFSDGKKGVGGEWSDLADETPSGRLVLTACAENVTGKWYFGIPEDRDAAERRFWFRYEMVFTHYLVKGFRGRADSNNDGKVTVEEAFWYARDKAYWSPGILRKPFRIHTGQTPMIYDGYPGYEVEGELYLVD